MTRTNRKLHIRALAVLLVLVNLLTLMPLPTHSSENDPVTVQTGGASFAIASDDGPVGSMTIFSYEKKEISVEGNTSADAYQWQIRHPQKTDLWVNIYDATSGCLPVTLALVKNMLDSGNSTQLRCRVNADGCEYYTAPLTVTYSSEDDGLPVVLADPTEPTVPEETVPETTIPEETVPETTVPEETVPETTVPEETIPETTIPEETIPETTIPEETVPETTIPEETVPETTVPEETVPETTISEESIPAETEAEAPVIPAVVEEAVAVEEEVIVEEEEEEVVAAPVMAAAAPAAEESSAEDSTPIEEDTPAPAAEEPPVEENIPAPMAEGDEPVTQEFVTVTIEYVRYDYKIDDAGKLVVGSDGEPVLDLEGRQAFTSYVATLRYGTPLNTTVPSPTMVGYDRYLNDSDTAGSGDSVAINLDAVTSDVTYTVKYKPAKVPYTVRYYFQNIYDDLYVENTDMKKDEMGFTGTTPHEDIIKEDVPGFTCLYYEPDFIAADGSTVFASYYERNYYLMEFDCDGGYGAETLYVRYGSYISVPTPVKAGWVFAGWDMVRSENPDGFTYAAGKDDLPATMPYYNTAYKALWATANTTFTVVYWVENADDDDYSYVASIEKVDGVTGDKVNKSNIANYGVSLDIPEEAYKNSDSSKNTLSEDVTRHIELNEQKTVEVTLDGNGASVFNIYYDRKEYSLKFYYAMSSGSGTNIQYYVVGGSTYGFGSEASSGVDTSKETKLLDQYMGNNGWNTRRGSAKAKPTLNAIGISRDYIEGADKSTTRGVEYTYYYIAFTEKFGADISTQWPSGVFNFVTMEDGYTSWTESDDAMVSAWNGEYRVEYNHNPINNGNQTVKGNYSKLDEYLLWRYSYANAYADTTDNDIDQNGENDDTAGTVAYLCFWENGASVDWSIPELYIYNIWVECMEDHEHPATEWQKNDKWYSLRNTYYTCDDSSIVAQTTPAISGLKSVGTAWSAVFIGSLDKNDAGYSGDKVSYNTQTQQVQHGNWYTDPAPLSELKTGDKYLLYDETPYPQDPYNRYTYDPSNPGEIINHTKYREAYSREFFFDRLDYTLRLENYGAEYYVNTLRYEEDFTALEDKTGTEKLDWDVRPPYPNTLEPNAYEFIGWYTGPNGSGLKIVFDSDKKENVKDIENGIWYNPIMPDDNVLLFANWQPITHDVYFYYDYQDYENKVTWSHKDINGDEVQYPILAEHGELLGTAYNTIPEAKEGYQFVGWFYIDEDNKKRFAPDTMEITRNLNLFAEWTTIIDTTYEIQYVLWDDVSSDNTPSHTAYDAGDPVADILAGHSSAGQTKTFNAKSLGDLYPDFQEKFFPDHNSHSILMDTDGAKNTWTFYYVYDPLVYYKVRYVDYATKTELTQSVIKSTTKAIVTEKFLPIAGYIPTNYYIRKTLASDGTATEPIEENVITFYYVKDEEHGLYAVEHYLEDMKSTESSNPDNYYLYESIVGTVDLNDQGKADYTAEYRAYDGYTVQIDMNTVENYKVQTDENGDIVYDDEGLPIITVTTKKGAEAGNPPSGTVDVGGLTIKIYYKRNEYPYIIEYREANTEKQLEIVANDMKPFDSLITHTAPATYTIDGIVYEYYLQNPTAEELTKSMTIRASQTDNKLVFYYNQKQVEVQYHAVWFDSDKYPSAEYGNVSINAEKGTITGSTATPAFGFLFDGWYKDEACTQLVNETWVTGSKLIPQELYQDDDWINHYYAKFVAVQSDLTIAKSGTGLNEDDSFLFHITGRDALNQDVDMIVSIQGAESVTIKDLYCGTYTVTELTNWSWTYVLTSANSQTANLTVDGEKGEVAFTNALKTVDWLHGETNEENQFDN